jgi:hypothetical protein
VTASGRTWLCFALLLLLPLSQVLAAESLLETQIQAVLSEGGSLAQQRHQLEAAQQRLLSQQQDMDAVGQRLSQRQLDLNKQAAAEDQQAAEQKGELQHNRATCNKDTIQASKPGDVPASAYNVPQGEHLGDERLLQICNNSIESLNRKTLDVNQEEMSLETQQNILSLEYSTYDLDVARWNYDEQDAIIQLNLIYLATNDWLDRSYDLMTSDSFQLSINSTHNNRYCSSDAIPSGHVTQQQLSQAADYLLNCFRRVDKARHQTIAP